MSNRRLLTFYAAVAALLFAVRLGLKDDTLLDAASFALGWSIATTAIFALSGALRKRRGESCALCDDPPTQPDRSA